MPLSLAKSAYTFRQSINHFQEKTRKIQGLANLFFGGWFARMCPLVAENADSVRPFPYHGRYLFFFHHLFNGGCKGFAGVFHTQFLPNYGLDHISTSDRRITSRPSITKDFLGFDEELGDFVGDMSRARRSYILGPENKAFRHGSKVEAVFKKDMTVPDFHESRKRRFRSRIDGIVSEGPALEEGQTVTLKVHAEKSSDIKNESQQIYRSAARTLHHAAKFSVGRTISSSSGGMNFRKGVQEDKALPALTDGTIEIAKSVHGRNLYA